MPCCVVRKCRSGYDPKIKNIHFFTPPKDPARLARWNIAIRRVNFELSEKDKICHLHFQEHHLINKDEFIIKGERVELPRLKWSLTPDAIPMISPKPNYKYLFESWKSSNPPAEKNNSNIVFSSHDTEQGSSQSLPVDNSSSKYQVSQHERNLKTENDLLKKTITKLRRQLALSQRKCNKLQSDLKKEKQKKKKQTLKIKY